jgi:hypothetical protein
LRTSSLLEIEEIFFKEFISQFREYSYKIKIVQILGELIMEILDSINWAILAPFFIIQFILLLVAIIDLVRIEKTSGPKWLWAIIILFVNIIGPILYFVIGRRNN